MKAYTSLAIVLLWGCSTSEKQSSAVEDSTAATDSVSGIEEVSNEDLATDEDVPEDTSALDDRFTAWKDAVDSAKDTLLEVSVNTKQYEASSDVTWYFDSDINPVYFYESWSVEGNHGSTERIVKDGSVVCSTVEENSTTEKWCVSTGGLRTMADENSGEESKTYLDDVYGNEQTASLKNDLATLTSLLREAEVTEQDDESLTLRIEEVVNHGEEFTEYVEVRIPRKVLEGLGVEK